MCGINTIANFKVPILKGSDLVKNMNRVLSHRGPDGEGIFIATDKSVVLGSRRLSIVDVAGGDMPIVIKFEEKTYAIIFNGEIFNFQQIRGKLNKKYQFKTKSDTEVVLYSYIEWGQKCVKLFNGQFAFVIYDEYKKEIFFARDHVGIKPLFYSVIGDTFLVSSEPKGILTYPNFGRVPNKAMIADYFLGTLVLGRGNGLLDHSFFDGILSLNPGTFGIFNSSGLTTKEYYAIPFLENRHTFSDCIVSMRTEVERAIKDQIPEEVLFGIGLSGGLDSSIVATITARNSHSQLIANTFRSEDAQNNPDYDYAKIIANKEHIKLISPLLSNEKVLSNIDHLIRAMDGPNDAIAQLSLLTTYEQLHKAGCKVALIGEGADEFNLGYYFHSPGFNNDLEILSKSGGFLELLNNRSKEALSYFSPSFINQEDFRTIVNKNVKEYYEACPSDDPLLRMEFYYIKKFLKYRLDINDRCSMAHSVEARVPFCDKKLIEISLSIPAHLNLKDGVEKMVLREAFRNLLPLEIIERRKYMSSGHKQTKLYRMILKEFDTLFVTSNTTIWEILNKDSMRKLRDIAEKTISDLELGKSHRSDIDERSPLTKPINFQMKHLFFFLTFMRWHKMYFVESIFS